MVGTYSELDIAYENYFGLYLQAKRNFALSPTAENDAEMRRLLAIAADIASSMQAMASRTVEVIEAADAVIETVSEGAQDFGSAIKSAVMPAGIMILLSIVAVGYFWTRK